MADSSKLIPTTSVQIKQNVDWKQIQSRTFKNWSNYMISDNENSKVFDLLNDFTDGVNLIQLLNHLAKPKKIKNFDRNPKTYFQKLDNLSKAFKFMIEEENIKLVGIGKLIKNKSCPRENNTENKLV